MFTWGRIVLFSEKRAHVDWNWPISREKYINNGRHLAPKYARIFVRGHYLFREANSFPRAKLEETVSYEEQIMSKDKYPSIFLPQMATIVFIILQIFFAMRAVWKLGNILGYSPVLAGEYSVTWRV